MRAFTLLASATAATAHTIFVQLEVAGKTYPVSYAIRDPTYDGPITNVASNDLACNGGTNPTQSAKDIITVAAGSTIKAIWRHTLVAGASDIMDPSHKGPTLAYLKKVDDALTDKGLGAGWFKIQEAGYSGGKWATSEVISNGGIHSIDIPACIPPGQYLLRPEMIALHGASSSGGAQLYMECAQLNITSAATSAGLPAKTYSIPGIYKATDPGILVNIYSMTASSTYTIPGPPVFKCGDATAGTAPASAVTSPQTDGSGAAAAPEAATSEAPAAAGDPAVSSCQVGQWQQCGGSSFSGCTTCASPYTCKQVNAYYNQCS